jgi:hypothetical protein
MQISNAASSPTLTPSGTSGTTTPDSDSATASVTSADATSTDTSSTSAAPSPSQDAAVNISPEGKSFTYGTLGLERPDQAQDNRNPFYTAGRWLAAGLTIGGIISLLV